MKSLLTEQILTIGVTLALSILIPLYIYDEVIWYFPVIMGSFALISIFIPRLKMPRKSASPEKLERRNAMAEQKRLKRVREQGWDWEICGELLCKRELDTGKTLIEIHRKTLRELWAVSTASGAVNDVFALHFILTEEETHVIEAEHYSKNVLDWALTLDGFDLEAFLQCMRGTESRKKLLWSAHQAETAG